MSKFEDMICGLQQDMEVPAKVWEKYTDTLSNLPDQSGHSSGRVAKRRLWPVAVAATMAVGVLGVSASAYIQWSKGLEEGLQTTAQQRQALEDSQMTSFVGQSVTQGDVKVTAQQSIVDNYFAHLSFKVEGYTAEEGKQPGFSGINVVVGGDEDLTGSWFAAFYDGVVPGSDGRACFADGTPLTEDSQIGYTMEDGSMEFQISMQSIEKGALLGQPIHVDLIDLGTYPGKAEEVETEVEGTWSFDWTLDGSDAAENYDLQAPLGDSGATVLQAELSPISVAVVYDFPRQEETELAENENGEEFMHKTYAEPPAFTGVRLKDGTICTGLAGGGSSGYQMEDSDIYEDIWALVRVIDVEQVESLLFIKSCPEGEQALTEENLYEVPLER